MARSKGTAAARRYAEAVFELADEGGSLGQWTADLATLASVASDADAVAVLENTKQPLEERIALVQRALQGLSPMAVNLATLLVQRGRFGLLPSIAEIVQEMVDRRNGVQRAEVVTAVPLSDEDLAAVRERLRATFGAADVRVQARVDPALIGGLVARVGDQLIDGSTRSRLIELRRQLAGSGGTRR